MQARARAGRRRPARSARATSAGTVAAIPTGSAGDAIPLGSQIVFICDAFDAMTTDRSYRRGMPEAAALEELRRHAGTQFSPAVVGGVPGGARRCSPPCRSPLTLRDACRVAGCRRARATSARVARAARATPAQRDDAAQPALAVDRHQRAEAAQRLRGEQALQRRVGGHLALRGARARRRRGPATAPSSRSAACSTAARWARPGEAAVVLHDGEPLPALVAEEEVLVGGGRPSRPAGIVTGSASMMSATVMPARRSVNAVCAIAPRAPWASSQPSGENQIASSVAARPTPRSRAGRRRPSAGTPKPIPMRAAKRVARWRSPVIFHATARAIRPPSSGKAGTRLNTSRNRFMVTSSETTTSDGRRRRAPGQARGVPERVRRRRAGRDRHGGQPDDRQRDERARDRDAELGARRVRVAVHPHHAAEQEQVDARHLDALAPGGERVPELVQQDRGEERQRRDHRDGVDRRARPRRASSRASPRARR